LDKARGLRITRRMEALSITVDAMAERCGVSIKTVYKWRAGHNLPSNRVIQLSKELACSTDSILVGHENPEVDEGAYLLGKMSVYDRGLLMALLRSMYQK